jgi:hypothetical protein
MSAKVRPQVLILCVSAMFLTSLKGIAAQPASGDPVDASSVSQSQTGSSSEKGLRKKDADSGQEKLSTEFGKILYLPGPDGSLVPVLLDATLKEYLEWLQKKKAKPAQRIPNFSVTSVELEGVADENIATLNATISVQVNLDNSEVLVPLGLNEATLIKPMTYKGNGEAFPGSFTRKAGYRWWLKGKGQHELKLQFLTPVRKTVLNRRLLLSIPQTAVSHLKLTILQRRLKFTPQAKSTPIISEQTANDKPGTMIDLYGLGNALDLQWQLLPDVKKLPPSLQVATEFLAKQTSESILLTATQSILTLQGSLEEISVHLPPGFKLIDIVGERYESHEVDADDPSHVVVRLTEPTAERDPLGLQWTLESDFFPSGGKFTLEGFQVDQARRETGKILIEALEGFLITKGEPENRFVHRTNVTSNGNENNQHKTAYRFLKQPFRLTVGLKEIEPRYSSEPNMTLHLTAERAELNAVFQIHVFRGAIETLELRWPKQDAEAWDLELMESPDLIKQIQIPEKSQSGSIRIQLVSRKTGRFELLLKASRHITVGEKPTEFSLPKIVGASRLPVTLNVTSANNVEAVIAPLGKTSLVVIPVETRKNNRQSFRIESQNYHESFSAKTTVHEQRVQTDTIVSLELKEEQLNISQQFKYEIAYEPLGHIRVMVPKELGDVKFYATDDVPLDPTWSDTDDETFSQAAFMLEKPTIGKFVLEARFNFSLSDELKPGSPQQLSLPLIQSIDTDALPSGQIRFRSTDGIELSVDDESWTAETSKHDFRIWNRDAIEKVVPMTLTKISRLPSQDYSVVKTLIKSTFRRAGFPRSRAQYRIVGAVKTVSLVLPPGIVQERFWWNKELVTEDQIIRDESAPEKYLLIISDEVLDGNFLLTIDFRLEVETSFAWNKPKQLQAPGFPQDVWVEQTIWEITLPGDQHLLVNPKGFTPQFDWERETVFWSRVSRPDYANLSSWISAEDGPSDLEESFDGNVYQFSRFGPTDRVEFVSLSRAIVVLFGAGLALAVGFVLKIVKLLRSFMTLLIAAFVLCVIGIWYAEPVKLLLQPAVLGLLLAVTAASVEGFLKRRRKQPILTLSSPSDYVMPSATTTTEHPLFVGAGSEDATAIHPESEPAGEPVSSSESSQGL